jgi:SAM-dependent methyltransferase
MTAPDSDRDAAVQRQYEDYPYPHRVAADEAMRLLTPPMDYLAKISHYGWRGAIPANPRFLVAGGGTGDSTIFLAEQARTLGGTVTQIDLSAASIGVAQARAQARGLNNVHFVQGRLEEVATLAPGPYDYINCAGVVHHTADPDLSVRALASVLAPGGAIGLMVYAHYGRTPTRHMRDLFARLLPPDTGNAVRVGVAQQMLAALPPTNALRRADADGGLIKGLLADPHELYDLLLHPRECDYTVPQFHALVAQAGLSIASFTQFFLDGGTNKSFYRAENYIQDQGLLARIKALPEIEQQAIAEVLHGNITLHSAYLVRDVAAVATVRQTGLVPYAFVPDIQAVAALLEQNPGRPLQVVDSYGNGITLQGQPGLGGILALIDGRRSVHEILTAATSLPALAGQPNAIHTAAGALLALFDLFNQFDWLLLRAPHSHPPIAQDQHAHLTATLL